MSLLKRILGGRPKVMPTTVKTEAEFEQHVLRADLPTIVDVWSPTCAPCNKLAHVLIAVATKYQERIQVVEISTAATNTLLARLDVMATPTLIIYQRGKELGRSTGFRPEGWFDDVIANEFPESATR